MIKNMTKLKFMTQLIQTGKLNFAQSASSRDITIYGTSFCSFCNKAKDYLDKEGISYRFISVQE